MGTTLTLGSQGRAIRTGGIASSIASHLPAVARVLLGALFLFSGLAGLLLSPQPPAGLPEGAVAFNAALQDTGYMLPLICGTEALVGALLLANRLVPLALALLAPVAVNILAFHLFLEPGGLGIALGVCALELYLAWGYRTAFRPMLAVRATR
jgi:uncharacterized membrane protein YphA (DoxX/SURF4 family)